MDKKKNNSPIVSGVCVQSILDMMGPYDPRRKFFMDKGKDISLKEMNTINDLPSIDEL